ncbi:MAG: hypothetical protein QOD77_2177 [Thermoplasmata archaeon]|jgi:hypothetical protein|nr:hypothetical protein [Thermoplasmata archaeon]
MMRASVALLALALVALPVHAASDAVVLTASTFTATGALTADGGLVAATIYDPQNGTHQGPAFTLTAPTLRVETQEGPAIYGPANLSPFPEPQEATYTAATVEGTALRGGFAFDIVNHPAATFRLETTCATEAASPAPTFTVEPRANYGRAPIERTTTGTLALLACGDSTLTVEGDFGVVLWAWDSRLSATEGDRDLSSGFTPSTEGPVSVGRVQQQYLWATGGRLTLSLASDAGHRLHVAAHTLALDGTATFTSATVALPGQDPAPYARAELMGSGALHVASSAGRVRADATGAFTLTADDATLHAPTAALPASPAAWPWLLAWGTVAILAAWLTPWGIGAWLLRGTGPTQRQARSRFWATLATLTKHPALARTAALHALRLDAGHASLAAVAHAHRLAHEPGQELLARERLASLLFLPSDRAQNAIEAARCAVALGETRAAVAWLMQAHDDAPLLTERRLLDAAFASLRNRPWVRLTLIDSRLGFA